MKTLEFSVGELGSELHTEVRLSIMMSSIPAQYSAGGDPYLMRLVTPENFVEEFMQILEDAGVKKEDVKIIDGAHSF